MDEGGARRKVSTAGRVFGRVENVKTAFYLYLQERVVGPYGADELKDMILHREVTGETVACREGETEWLTVADMLGAQMPAAKSGVPVSLPMRGVGNQSRGHEFAEPETHRGIDRSTYFFVCLLIGVGSWLADRYLSAPVFYLPRIAAAAVVTLGVTVARTVNIGKSAWWSLLIFIPFVNIYVSFLCLAAQSGYQRTGRLDRTGRTIFFVFLASVLALFALVLFGMIVSTQTAG